MMRFLLLMALALSLTNGIAHAELSYISGSKLRAMCTEPGRKDVCAGFVAAVAESIDDMNIHVTGLDANGDTCVQIPRAVSVGQLIAATNHYVAQHPELWHETGYVLVQLALDEAFPCTGKPAWTQNLTKNAAR